MELWILLMVIAAPVVIVLGWLFWIAVFGLIASKSVEAVSRLGASAGSNRRAGELDAIFTQLDQMLRAGSVGDGAAGLENLPLQQKLEIQTILLQAQNQMSQVNDIGRQRYETRMGELSGMAASAGLDLTPRS